MKRKPAAGGLSSCSSLPRRSLDPEWKWWQTSVALANVGSNAPWVRRDWQWSGCCAKLFRLRGLSCAVTPGSSDIIPAVPLVQRVVPHSAVVSSQGRDGETGRRSGLKIRRPERVVGVQVPLPAPLTNARTVRRRKSAGNEYGIDSFATGCHRRAARNAVCRNHGVVTAITTVMAGGRRPVTPSASISCFLLSNPRDEPENFGLLALPN
jgi:hypothetical protein